MHRDLCGAAGGAVSGNAHPPRSAREHATGRCRRILSGTRAFKRSRGSAARRAVVSHRRERETQWLFAAAFLWGGFIATALALPFNTAFFALVDLWVAQHPIVSVVLGPDAAIMLAAPISAPIAEEITKALGVLLIFWLLRAEFDNLRDGIVYGAWSASGSIGLKRRCTWLKATPRMEWCHMAPSSGADTRS